MTAACWLAEHHTIEFKQSGEERAECETAPIAKQAQDFTRELGRWGSRQGIDDTDPFSVSVNPPNGTRSTSVCPMVSRHVPGLVNPL